MRIILSVLAGLLVLLLGMSISTNVYYRDGVSKINREARSYGVSSSQSYGVVSLLDFLEVQKTKSYFRGLTYRLGQLEHDRKQIEVAKNQSVRDRKQIEIAKKQLALDNEYLQAQIFDISVDYKVLASEFDSLYSSHTQLERDYSWMENDYSNTKRNYSQMEKRVGQVKEVLHDRMRSIETSTDPRAPYSTYDLVANVSALTSVYMWLEKDYSQIQKDYALVELEMQQVRTMLQETLLNAETSTLPTTEPRAAYGTFDFIDDIKAIAAILTLF